MGLESYRMQDVTYGLSFFFARRDAWLWFDGELSPQMPT
jgi:hypothetical protein